jgi:hypothetical protein
MLQSFKQRVKEKMVSNVTRDRFPILNPGDIRIVLVRPGKPTDPIVCDLEIMFLDGEGHDYQALSYVWGDATMQHSITLNGHIHHVTGNLLAALHRLRMPTIVRKLWIDALCIDQSNVAERNTQVKMMKRIYSLKRMSGVLGAI